MVRSINLTEGNSQKLDYVARQTGKTPDEVANEAIGNLAADNGADEQRKFEAWKAALERFTGMWEHREDLPDFDELRRSWDRNSWEEGK